MYMCNTTVLLRFAYFIFVHCFHNIFIQSPKGPILSIVFHFVLVSMTACIFFHRYGSPIKASRGVPPKQDDKRSPREEDHPL